MKRSQFERELRHLQVELCHLQAWVKHHGLRVVVVFEGRDTAGKGGVIKRITQRVSPRVFRVVALPAPTDREKTQLYMQRYIGHFPAAGEVVLFDRSWYNRAGVERVMGFCTDEEYEAFMRTTPGLERDLTDAGIILIKYFLDVSQEEQKKRLHARFDDPLRQWKLSPMDLTSWERWWDYTEAYNRMMLATDTAEAPWYIVDANDQRRARLNCIKHLLSMIDYAPLDFEAHTLPKQRKQSKNTPDMPTFRTFVPAVY